MSGRTTMRSCLSLMIGLLVTLGVRRPAKAQGATWQVQSETTAQVYRFLDAQRSAIQRTRFTETLRAGARVRVGEQGFIFARTLLRLDGDPEVTRQEADRLVATRPTRLDLLGASVAGVGLLDGHLDFELGRFIRLDSLGFALIDGGSVEVRTPWHFGLGVHGGIEPAETLGPVTSNPFRLDGFREEDGEPVVWMVGASAFTRDLGLHSARVDFREWQDTDGNTRARQIAGSLRLAFPDILFVDADLRYDLIGQILSDLRAGLRMPIAGRFDIDLRYERLIPTFDTESIWSIFPLYPLQQTHLGARVHLGRDWVLAGRVSVRVLENAEGADPEPGGAVFANWRHGRKSALLSFEHFGGPSGIWDLVEVEGAIPLGRPDLLGRAGLSVAYIDDGVSPGLKTTAWGGHVELDYRFAPGWTVRLHVEDHESRLEKHAVRGFMILRAELGTSSP